MKPFSLFLLTLLLLCGLACRKEAEGPSGDPVYSLYTLTVATSQTRSDLVDDTAAGAARDIRLAVYSDGKRVASGRAPLELRLMADRPYNFYAWTGSSLSLDEVPGEESELTQWEAVYPGWDTAGNGPTALSDLLSEYGMPMAGTRLNCYPDDIAVRQIITVPLQRMFARVRLRISYDEAMALLLPERSIKQICLHNWAWACHPFSEAFDPEKVHGSTLDYATEPDEDGAYTLYLPENLQGIRTAGDPDRCSYISVALNLNDGYGLGGGVGDVCYRFYPGVKASDGYNLRRNRQYDVTLNLSYNGRFIEGEWQVSGDDAEQRRLAFDPEDCQPVAEPGGKAYLRLRYHAGESEDAISSYYNRFNGVAVGLEAETQAWVSNGAIPTRSALEVVGSVRCRHCGNRFWGYPEQAADRLAWAEERLESDGNTRRCPVCRTLFFSIGSVAADHFTRCAASETDPFQLTSPEPHIAVTLPDDVSMGSRIVFHARTRDGRIHTQTQISVGTFSAPYFSEPLEGEQYVAEKVCFSPVSMPADITELRYRVVDGAGRVLLSQRADNGADISLLQDGEVEILVEDQNGTVRQRIGRTILNPGLRFLSDEYSLAVDGTDLTPAWTYTRKDGTVYSDYDPDLYALLLGDPDLSVDGVWTAVSEGNVHIRRTSDDSLGDLPYLSSSIGTLTATCPLIPSITGEANLKAVNPFVGWPSSPLTYSIAYSWSEGLKKATSLPFQYDASMSLRNLIGTPFPLYAETVRGNPPFTYSEAEARAHVAVSPTVSKRPSVTRYYGQVVNRHSGTALQRFFATVAVNVEAYCTESHAQTAGGNTQTWTITVTCRNPVGSVPTHNELTRVFTENRTASIYPTAGRWGHGLTGLYWHRAYYTFGVQDATYEFSMVLASQAESGTGDGTFSDFAGQNPVQFSAPYALDDGYTYLQIEGEPLGSPSDQGVWKIQFNPDWQTD